MQKHLSNFLLATILMLSPSAFLSSNVILKFQGQWGNHLFQIATAVALAEENDCSIYFPDFDDLFAERQIGKGLLKNYNALFHSLPYQCDYIEPSFTYEEKNSFYTPIPYRPNMEIVGYFQTEKYFMKHKEIIQEIFAAPVEIENRLQSKFQAIIDYPKTVGIHVRTCYPEWKEIEKNQRLFDVFLPPDIEYYKKAIAQFDKDSLFLVFSDHIGWCKKNFKGLEGTFIFIEGQDYLDDFYLLSKCKHTIVGSSTFSWWAAYLNQNPNKKVICRKPFLAIPSLDPKDIICADWTVIEMSTPPPRPTFEE